MLHPKELTFVFLLLQDIGEWDGATLFYQLFSDIVFVRFLPVHRNIVFLLEFLLPQFLWKLIYVFFISFVTPASLLVI